MQHWSSPYALLFGDGSSNLPTESVKLFNSPSQNTNLRTKGLLPLPFTIPMGSFGNQQRNLLRPVTQQQLMNTGSRLNSQQPSFLPKPSMSTNSLSSNVALQSQPQENGRPVKCDGCPQSFNRNHDLKRHKRIHLGSKSFSCGPCDKSFSRKDALRVRTSYDFCENYEPAAPGRYTHQAADGISNNRLV